MILFKACSRCKGDLLVGSDMYGSYARCLQCGHSVDYDSELALVTAQANVRKVDEPTHEAA